MLGILETESDLAWVRKHATLIDATEAAHWFFEENDKDVWDISEDLHRLTAPGELTWIEFAAPSSLRVIDGLHPGIERMGALVVCIRIEDEDRHDAIAGARLERFFGKYIIGGEDGERMIAKNIDREDFRAGREKLVAAGRIPGFMLGFRILTKALYQPLSAFSSIFAGIYLDEDGKAFKDDQFMFYAPSLQQQIMSGSSALGDTLQDNGDAETMRLCYAASVTFAFILSLMNCRNVTLSEPEPIHHQRAERRRMARAGQEPVAYRWLRIKQLQKRVDADAEASGAMGKKRRLHQVRAHWAHYDADAPLFGRPGMVGTFFRPQSLRGRAEVGEIHKGYKPIPSKNITK